MWQQKALWRAGAVTLVAAAVFASSVASRAEEPAPPIDLFISPYCGLSVARIADAIPKLGGFTNSRTRIRFNLIALGGDQSEEHHLQQLACADQQGALPPMYLYIANTAHEGREPHAERFLAEFGINREKFVQCMQKPSGTRDILKASSDRFWSSGLRGVPAVKYRETTFTLTNFDHVIALRDTP